MERICKITLLFLAILPQWLAAQPTTRIQLPQLAEAPNTDTVWVIVSSGDTAIWAIADTLTTAGGGEKYFSIQNSTAWAFDTLDFTERQDILSTPIYLDTTIVGGRNRLTIGYDLGLIDANESQNSGDYGIIYTGTIARRATLDTLFGFDVFQLNGTTLEISQRLDGDATYSVDLSSLAGSQIYAIAADYTSAVYGLTTTPSTLDTINVFTASAEFSESAGVVTFSGSEKEWYLVNFHSNFSCDTQGSTISFLMYDGAAPQTASTAATYIETANEVYNVSGTVLMNLENTDTITIRAATDAGTPDITVDYVTFTIIRL